MDTDGDTKVGVASDEGSIELTHRLRAALREREKELACLYDLFRLAQEPGATLNTILRNAAKALPGAWQFPDIAIGCIVLDGTRYPDVPMGAACAAQRATIEINGTDRGHVEVAYVEPRPPLDEGPFLKEERSLIDAIARQIAVVVERRQAEEERERLQDQLRHADRLATIGLLASGVAHELNEPLGNVLGLAQLALKAEDLSEPTTRDLQNIEKASLHAREVVKKLMLFARQTPPDASELDLNRLVEDGLYFLASRCSKEGIDMVVDLQSDLPCLWADGGQLHQVLVNLVVSALQSMPKGGQLTVRTRHGRGDLVLEVQDTGGGIDEEIRRHIFMPFFTTKDVDHGTGLGLAVVHGIVTAHGGTVEVETEVGKGSIFRVRFPVERGEGDPSP